MRTSIRIAGAAGTLLLLLASHSSPPARAAILGQERVASGLTYPVFATHAPNDPDRLFIVEVGSPDENSNATANIRILNLDTGILEPTPFLTIPGLNTNGEGGLLGMAFHPDYETNGQFYVYLTANDNVAGTPFSSYIRQYEVSSNPNVADPNFTPILNFTQPQTNHDGGWIGFGPNDGYLYVMTGDGGGGGDTGTGHTTDIGNAQDLDGNLRGKVLRIDVDGDDFTGDADLNYAIPATNPFVHANDPTDVKSDEIWAYGLRNPYRASFDRQTGDLWIGDVGQSNREEIDFQPATSMGGENYGWRLWEGNEPYGASSGDPFPDGYVGPAYDYPRSGTFGGTTVIGGYVYRGPDPDLEGQYVFADAGASKFWMFDPADTPIAPADRAAFVSSIALPTNFGSPSYPVSFGEDEEGNLYIAYLYNGEVYRIVTGEALPGDYNHNGTVDAADYTVWRDAMTAGSTSLINRGPNAGAVDEDDFLFWRAHFGESAGAGSGAAAVPEPGGLFLASQVLCFLTGMAWYNRK